MKKSFGAHSRKNQNKCLLGDEQRSLHLVQLLVLELSNSLCGCWDESNHHGEGGCTFNENISWSITANGAFHSLQEIITFS